MSSGSTTNTIDTIDVFIVRHGETDYNKEGRIQGNMDVSRLTEKGRKQAAEVGRAIAQENTVIDRIFISPLARARHTFDIMEQEWRQVGFKLYPICAPTFIPDLQEIALYEWQGQLKADLKVQEADAYHNWNHSPAQFRLGDRFPVRELWGRARNAWVQMLSTAKPGETIMICAHSGINQALVSVALGHDETLYRGLPFPNCGALHLRLRLPSNAEEAPQVVENGSCTLPVGSCLCPKTRTEVETHYRTIHPPEWQPDIHPPKEATA